MNSIWPGRPESTSSTIYYYYLHTVHMHVPTRSCTQESIEYCQQCLEKIYQVNGLTHPDIVALENHFEPTFKPHLEEPTKVYLHM
jgi:hypothetical protein